MDSNIDNSKMIEFIDNIESSLLPSSRKMLGLRRGLNTQKMQTNRFHTKPMPQTLRETRGPGWRVDISASPRGRWNLYHLEICLWWYLLEYNVSHLSIDWRVFQNHTGKHSPRFFKKSSIPSNISLCSFGTKVPAYTGLVWYYLHIHLTTCLHNSIFAMACPWCQR